MKDKACQNPMSKETAKPWQVANSVNSYCLIMVICLFLASYPSGGWARWIEAEDNGLKVLVISSCLP